MMLKDEVAIVTGGTKGIGRAISLLFAEEGAKVVANFSKDVDAAEVLKKEVKSRGVNISLYKADVTQVDQAREMVEETFAQYGKIDILVNNVGLIRDNFLMLMSAFSNNASPSLASFSVRVKAGKRRTRFPWVTLIRSP